MGLCQLSLAVVIFNGRRCDLKQKARQIAAPGKLLIDAIE